jgi:hypothetical protein
MTRDTHAANNPRTTRDVLSPAMGVTAVEAVDELNASDPAPGSYAATHPGWVVGYMTKERAVAHAGAINGRVFYAWASGIDTWQVYR